MAMTAQDTTLRSLHDLFAPEQVVSDPISLLTYDCDAGLDRGKPLAVVFPHNTDDVVKVMQWAYEHRVPLVARGAGTGLSGGAVAERGGVIVEFARMEGILEFDQRGGSVVAQLGVVTQNLDLMVKKYGWYYPPDPSSGRASVLGGNIGENSGGPHCFKYGVTSNYVSELETVLADGQRIRVGGPATDYPELDLPGVLTGSEGTLGLMTQARLRLIRTPPAVKTAIAAFDSVEKAGEAVSDIIAEGLMPATMEMMDHEFMQIVEDFSPSGLPTEAGASLIIEVDGYPESVGPQMDEIVSILEKHISQEILVAQDEEQRAKIWYGRKSAAGAMARLAPKFYLVDGTVPRSNLAAALAGINAICKRYELGVVYVAHAGDGNLHPLVLIPNPKDPELMHRIHESGREIMQHCIDYDGSITGEHGVGIEKRAFMPLMYSAEELQTMQDIKAVFDPQNLLNPGKIFPADTPAPAPLPTAGKPPKSPFAPASAQEAAEAIRAWTAQGQQIRVVGAGTKSRNLPDTPAKISTSAMNEVAAFARDDMYVTVGAGTQLADLQNELAHAKMWVPLASPWAESTVGGIVATNFNAPLRMRYGGARDLVLAATVALPNGRTIRAGRPVVKNVAGYDLPKLMTGSHGTLGLLTDVTLKVLPMPRAQTSLILPVSGDSEEQALRKAIELGMELRKLCMVASALLLCRGSAVANVASNVGDAPFALVYTLEGLSEDVRAETAIVQNLLQTQGMSPAKDTPDLSGSSLWAQIVQAADAPNDGALVRLGISADNLAHLLASGALTLGSGPFVADLVTGLLYLQASGDVAARLAVLRGTVAPQRGYACAPTRAGAAYDVWGYTPEGLALMQGMKQTWDAQGLFNPGAFLI